MEPLSIEQLGHKEPGDSVRCFEGKITDAFPPKRGNKNGKDWALQNAKIEQGGSVIKVLFNHEGHFLGKDSVGQTIRLMCSAKGNKLQGVTLAENTYNGVTERLLQVSRSAIVELNPDSSESTPPQSKAAARPASSPPARSASSPPPRPVGNGTSVDRRVALYFKVFDEVCARAELSSVKLTPSDLKDVATHISMTYRGDYGAYAEPVFAEGASSETAPAPSEPDADKSPNPSPEEPADNWRLAECNGEVLGQVGQAELRFMIMEAFTQGKNQDNAPLYQAAKEIKYLPKPAFIDLLNHLKLEFNSDVLNDFYEIQLGHRNPTMRDFLSFMQIPHNELKDAFNDIADDQIPF